MNEKENLDISGHDIMLPDFGAIMQSSQLPDNHTSFLLGAGFSVNRGYPTAKELNDCILKVNFDDYSVFGDGSLVKLGATKKDPNYFMPDALSKHFLKALIELFQKENGTFDYEKFYDFIVNPKLKESNRFKSIAQKFRKDNHIDNVEIPFEYSDDRLLQKSIKLLNQLIEVLLVDRDGNSFYTPVHQMKPLPNEYTGILQLLEKLGENSVVHVHTLNHDLLFETFQHTDWLGLDLSNGFDELGSKFYGRIENNVMIRLECFTNQYNTRFRLYKLHGSLDQFPFRHQDGSQTEFIKTKSGVNISNFYKEVQSKSGEFSYENDFTNYYADFLSGTTTKILRYNEGGYYKEVFSHFIENLKKSDRLVIVGYGCMDSRINELILDNFDYQNKDVYIIDPFPSNEIKDFAKKINATIIEQTPDKPLLDKIKL